MTHRLTTKEFITRSNDTHNNKYTYLYTKYVNSKTKVTITCPEHGNFEQIAGDHLNGRGCRKCGGTSRLTNDEVIRQLEALPNIAEYSYSEVDYVNNITPIIIICKHHGPFEQLLPNHLKGHGCIKCKHDAQRITPEEFLHTSMRVHSGKYTYGPLSTTQLTLRSPITVICPNHGPYVSTLGTHMRGSNCLKCVNEAQTKTLSTFIQESKDLYGDLFSYEFTKYVNKETKLLLTCTSCGNLVTTTPGNHLHGGSTGGCSTCSQAGFDKNKPGLLYYFKVCLGSNTAWKIGITNNSIRKRYSLAERNRMSNIISVWYENGAECYAEEQRILKEFNMHKYTGPKLLNSGNTELFNMNIFYRSQGRI